MHVVALAATTACREKRSWLRGRPPRLELLEPGLVEASRWRPDPDAESQPPMEWIEFAGVARKPA